MDTIGNDAIAAAASSSTLSAKYRETIDRESAYERMNARVADVPAPAEKFDIPPLPADLPDLPPSEPDGPSAAERIMGNPAVKSFLRSAASAAGREISRSIFGTGRRRRRR